MGIAAEAGVSPNLVRRGGFCASAVGSTDAGLFVVSGILLSLAVDSVW